MGIVGIVRESYGNRRNRLGIVWGIVWESFVWESCGNRVRIVEIVWESLQCSMIESKSKSKHKPKNQNLNIVYL